MPVVSHSCDRARNRAQHAGATQGLPNRADESGSNAGRVACRQAGSGLRIFEACNFQDLSGQRITKVIATLKFVEEHIPRMMETWGGIEAFRDYTAAAIATRDQNTKSHGPKLEGDAGYSTQEEVDALFASD